MSESEDIASRLIDTASYEVQYVFKHGIRRWASYCESPIETMFLSALSFDMAIYRWCLGKECIVFEVKKQSEPFNPEATLTVVPQFQWNEYRIDFACFILKEEKPFVFIECDGHEFHERTAAQAERDRKRDRDIQQSGISILRFTGREIYRDPFDCASQLLHFIGERRK